ncbi:uncharacterized protein FFB20_09187 [Fusarium fujikuroi]|nr:hypothetical protein CEK27_008735 [Fusarium fujikuroi]QGI95649.1 hypothetical protein CEK26_008718 [Fusarium fujikuroi]SCN92344.1 uncharacterized protein FFB20_09187 [Fusarium fujikuroi]SCO32058.1 uncharacterized protein FFNC_02658 [Fusarium fujikuroi]SCO45145.1 uncharacterized protein FFMR_07831 [Fusarium fujikuroi]
MLKVSLCDKFRSLFGDKLVAFGPDLPDSYPVYITHDLVRSAMNVIADRNIPWPIDPEYRVEMVMVKVPLNFCPQDMIKVMPLDRTGRHSYAAAIAKARFQRTPKHPGGELVALAMADWNEMAVGFSIEPREHVSVVPLNDRTHKNEGTN